MSSTKSNLLVSGQDLCRSFDRGGDAFRAVDAASFQIRSGDQIALVGQSGSGKSTLLNLIAGIDTPSDGQLSWPTFGARESLRPAKIAVMFQSLSLVPTLTVKENVALPLALLQEAKDIEALVLSALERFGLGELAHKLPEELSGGQSQRVSLARATVTRPQLVIADEPTGQIDHKTSALVVSALRDWARECGTSLLVATHDAEVAAQFPIRWHLAHGRLSTEQMEVML